MYKTTFFVFMAVMFASGVVNAQDSAQKDAAYFAVLKAVADYKIDDDERFDQIEKKTIKSKKEDERKVVNKFKQTKY